MNSRIIVPVKLVQLLTDLVMQVSYLFLAFVWSGRHLLIVQESEECDRWLDEIEQARATLDCHIAARQDIYRARHVRRSNTPFAKYMISFLCLRRLKIAFSITSIY